MAKATLIDTTKCIGCKSCQVTCKQWNQLPAEKTSAPEAGLGLQNPKTLSAKTYVVIQQHEVDDPNSPGGLKTVFAKRQCMHCDEPACAAACPVTAMHKTDEGPVTYDQSKCIGCRYCLWACPWGVPTAEWDKLNPKISKCDMCYSRLHQHAPVATNGQPLSADVRKSYEEKSAVPACVKQCPAGALTFGDREELLAEAKRRIKEQPGKYVEHIYGEHEAGGTGMLYLSSVPFDQIGFPKVNTTSYVTPAATALAAVPPAVIGVGAALGGISVIAKRRQEVAKAEAAEAEAKASKVVDIKSKAESHDHHVEFAPEKAQGLFSPANKLLLGLMGFGGISFLLRFILGLGGSTNLSDTYAWGLWIVFDLVWIAVAAGAFATAGLIYVLRRKDLYSIGRSAVLMGLLSYSFVTVTLLADLGMPWHFYELALNAPHHSAMFEVSWCVGLYVTILALEFLPVALGHFSFMKKYMTLWAKYAPMYVVGAVTMFVYLLSRKLSWTALAFVVFSIMAYAFRNKEGQKPEPIMLAIAAVTLSTMHQSSLGSLFLLMPDKLDAFWWSPIMPVYFFLSSIAAGTALIVLMEMWIAKAFKRQLRMKQLASMGAVAFWSLLVYEIVRVGDLAYRGQLATVLSRPSPLFLAELLFGGVLPLVLLATPGARNNKRILFAGTLLSCGGVVFNRMNVVIFAMTLKGAMPQTHPAHYMPSIFEWGISVGLIAATIFLFGLGARYLPVLPKQEAVSGD